MIQRQLPVFCNNLKIYYLALKFIIYFWCMNCIINNYGGKNRENEFTPPLFKVTATHI